MRSFMSSCYFLNRFSSSKLYIYIVIALCIVFYAYCAMAEKRGINYLLSQESSVGNVISLKKNKETKMNTVIAKGIAPIYNGKIKKAKESALRMAYSNAIAQVCRVEIGSWTLIRNAKHVNDIILSKSRGFIKSYDIISEGIELRQKKQYQVEIEAKVIEKDSACEDRIHGLNLYLRLLGYPKILIMLPTKGNSLRQAKEYKDTGTQFQGIEAAMAQAFRKYRYQIITSDDIVATGVANEKILQKARFGSTTKALQIAREIGADIVISGVLHLSTQTIEPFSADKEMNKVSANVSTKALIVSSGKLITANHLIKHHAAFDQLSAYSRCMDTIAKEITDALAWEIPKILVESNRETRLVIHNINIPESHDIKYALTEIGFDEARIKRLPTQSNKMAKLTLLSSFSRPENYEIYQACKKAINKDIQIDKSNKYVMEMIAYTPKVPDHKVKLKAVASKERLVVAMLDFNTTGENVQNNSLGRMVSENLTNLVVSKKIFDIVERKRLKEVLDEQEIGHPGGEFDNELLGKIKDLTGADAVFTGTVIKMGDKLDITVRMIDIKTAVTMASANKSAANKMSSVKNAVRDIVLELKHQAYANPEK